MKITFAEKVFHNSINNGGNLHLHSIKSSRNKQWNNICLDLVESSSNSRNLVRNSAHTIYICLSRHSANIPQEEEAPKCQDVYEKRKISFIPAGLPTFEYWDKKDRYLKISIAPYFIQEIVKKILSGKQNSQIIKLLPDFYTTDIQIESLGIILLSEVENESLGGELYIESLTNTLGIYLIRKYSQRIAIDHISANSNNGFRYYQLEQVIDYIDKHLGQKIKISDLSKLLGISKFHFSRLFKKSTNITPSEYIIQQRVEKAKKLLQNKELIIADVAFECGFNSQSYLSSSFRRITGLTPR